MHSKQVVTREPFSLMSFTGVSFVTPLISVTAALALAEGKKKKWQREFLPPEWQPTSEEEPAAPHLLRQIPGTHAYTKGHLVLLCR